ncbi:MAG: sodium/proton-translocating pyrophosphatase, partial [Thermoguttaceae bacterium]
MVRFRKLGNFKSSRLRNRLQIAWLALLCAGCVVTAGWLMAAEKAPVSSNGATAGAAAEKGEGAFRFFEPFLNTQKYPFAEQAALVVVLLIAVAGLVYARMLVKQVREADEGTPQMQEIAGAVREGANAYLSAQARKIVPLIVVITVALFFTKYSKDRPADTPFAIGRAVAFLLGSLFSLAVGWNGMKLATTGNLRVAAAARRSYG